MQSLGENEDGFCEVCYVNYENRAKHIVERRHIEKSKDPTQFNKSKANIDLFHAIRKKEIEAEIQKMNEKRQKKRIEVG
jgi:hypothetical protein